MMLYQLDTRAGLEPPWSSFNKRFLNTGPGGGSSGAEIAAGYSASQIVINLLTQLGQFNTAQSATFNYLLHTNITNTSANTYAGIHWMANGQIRTCAGGTAANRTLLSPASYFAGDVLLIQWVLSFPSISTSVTGTQTLYINGVQVATGAAHSGAFGSAVTRFALNSVCANDNSVLVERFTDQKIRQFGIDYIDGGYTRNWDFNIATGYEVPNTANAINDPLRLYGGNGINTLGGSWPEDNSQWDLYQSGSGGEEQIQSIDGTFLSVSSGSLSSQIINEQVLTVAGTVPAIASGIVSTALVNEQVYSFSGTLLAYASGQAGTAVVNEQVYTVDGIAAAVSYGQLSSQVINEQAGEQVQSIDGTFQSVSFGALATAVINEQVFSAAGTFISSATGVLGSSVVSEQIQSITGTALSVGYGVLDTAIINEQPDEQVESFSGEFRSVSYGYLDSAVINEQVQSFTGALQAISTGNLSSQVINRGNIELAPELMSATRVMPALVAQHIVPAVTGSRLINNISAQRV